MMHNTLRVFFCLTLPALSIVKASYKVAMFGNKSIRGCSFQKTSETTIENCLARCLENCLCRSFDTCSPGETCSLCLSNATSLNTKDGCGYFALERNLPRSCTMVRKTCLQDTNCCQTSLPCLNDGTCKPSYPSDILHSPRFTCVCAPGFKGNRCEQPIKSCRGYMNKNDNTSNIPASGEYTIIDEMNKPFQVFCDFSWSWNRDALIYWTLIQSYQFRKRGMFQKPFFQDSPISNEIPNWKSYRLSTSRIRSIQKDSTKWRMTCRYETEDGLNYTDYVEGLKIDIDILKLNATKTCKKVEFINVRGYNCTQCEAMMKQKRNLPFHHDSYRSYESCSFKPRNSIACNSKKSNKIGEDNFGRYKCTSTTHRCSMDNETTTQMWLGQ